MSKPETDRRNSPQVIRTMVDGLHYGVGVLHDEGLLPFRVVDDLEIIQKETDNDSGTGLQIPIKKQIGRLSTVTLYWDNAVRCEDEFSEFMPQFNEIEVERLCVFFSTSVALGGMALERGIRKIARTPKLTKQLHELLTDRTDYQEYLIDEFGSDPKAATMRNLLDSHSSEINGMRAAMAIVRSAYRSRDGVDPISEEAVELCREAFIDHVRSNSGSYTELTKNAGWQEIIGINVFSYSVPEWLPVMAFPMEEEKVIPFVRQ